MPRDGRSMLSITIGSGGDDDSPVAHFGWVIPRQVAEDLLDGFREAFGAPPVEAIGTVGGAVDSYERSQREGTAIFLPARGGEDA